MKLHLKLFLIGATLGLFTVAPVQAQSTTPTPASTGISSTAVNQGDEQQDAITPFSQSNDPADLKITQQIRKAIVAQQGLSVDAQNIKIITTTDHTVYLKGVVDNAAERKTIVHLAKKIAAHRSIKNELLLPAQTASAAK